MVSDVEHTARAACDILLYLTSYYVYNVSLFSTCHSETSEYYKIMKDKYEEMPFMKLAVFY